MAGPLIIVPSMLLGAVCYRYLRHLGDCVQSDTVMLAIACSGSCLAEGVLRSRRDAKVLSDAMRGNREKQNTRLRMA